MIAPERIFLDTNVYIVGAAEPDSPEHAILLAAGYRGLAEPRLEVIISQAVVEQVARVGRRLRGKDWASALVNDLWRLNFHYTAIEVDELTALLATGTIPREDASIYLTARAGQVQYFVSNNNELIRAIAAQTGEFECLTPVEFVQKYLQPPE